MTPQEKTIDRIKKLLAKANNEGCTREEAAAFAAKAAEIAAREQLELNEIDWEDRKKEQPIGTYHFWPETHDIKRSKRRIRWMEDLVSSICRSHSCRIILMGGNSYDIIGRAGNVEIASYLCAFLIRFVLNMSERDYGAYFRKCAREGHVESAQGFKDSWRIGFVDEVQRRIAEMKAHLEKEYKGSMALVRVKTEIDEATDWMDENRSLRSANSLTYRLPGNAAGVKKGTQAGSGVDITGRGVKEGKDTREIQ